MSTQHDLTIERVACSELTPHPENPRRGDIDLLVQSLMVNKLYKPIIRQQSTGHVLVGNHTLQAAIKLGWDDIQVITLDVSDDEALRILLADNRTSDRSTYDDELLAGLLQQLPDLDGTGFSEDDLDDLLAITSVPDVIDMGKQKGNGGKALSGVGLQWGYLQYKTRRVQLTAREVERLDAMHDLFVETHGTEAGWMSHVADLVLGPDESPAQPETAGVEA